MFKKIEKVFCRIEAIVLCSFLVIGILMVFGAVVTRYIFNSPISWIDEVYPIVFSVGISLGYAIDFKEDGLINVDVLYNAIKSPKIRNILDIIYALSGVVYGGLMTWLCLTAVQMQTKTHKSTLILHIPLNIVYSCLVAAGILLLIRGVFKLISTIRDQTAQKGESH